MVLATYRLHDQTIVICRRSWRDRLLTLPWRPWKAYAAYIDAGVAPAEKAD